MKNYVKVFSVFGVLFPLLASCFADEIHKHRRVHIFWTLLHIIFFNLLDLCLEYLV